MSIFSKNDKTSLDPCDTDYLKPSYISKNYVMPYDSFSNQAIQGNSVYQSNIHANKFSIFDFIKVEIVKVMSANVFHAEFFADVVVTDEKMAGKSKRFKIEKLDTGELDYVMLMDEITEWVVRYVLESAIIEAAKKISVQDFYAPNIAS